MPVIGRYAEGHPELQIDVRFTDGSFSFPSALGRRGSPGRAWRILLEDVKTYRLVARRRDRGRAARLSEDSRGCAVRFRRIFWNQFGVRRAGRGGKERSDPHPGATAWEALQFDPQVIVRNHMASLAAALTGLGVGLLIPACLARPYLESGRLERLLPEWEMPPQAWLTGKEAASPHLAGLIEEMQELFRVNPDLEPSV